MKNTHLILTLVILSLTGCFTKWFMASDSEMTITRELDASDADKVQLYEDCRTWSAEKFGGSDPVILEEDLETGTLVVSGYFSPVLFLLPQKTYFTLTFLLADERLTATFTDIYTIDDRIDETEKVDYFTKSELADIHEEIDKLMDDLAGYLGDATD